MAAVEFDDDIAPPGVAVHWTGRYIGRPYVPGFFDCAHLVERVQREHFGRDVRLPQHRISERSRELSTQIAAEQGFFITPREGAPEEGDCALMVGAGRLNHVGVVVLILGEVWVLHNFIRARQVALHRVRDLDRYGLTVEGYYAWK